MNVYDFDGTIYDGDSSLDFYLYCLKKHKLLMFILPYQGVFFILHKIGIVNTKTAKEKFFCFLKFVEERDINNFVRESKNKIKQWYKKQYRPEDLVISASPFFLVKLLCEQNGIDNVIATDMDKKTGEIIGENCKGEEKVKRFRKYYHNMKIDTFYTDTKSDLGLAKIADKAFMVKGNQINEWIV